MILQEPPTYAPVVQSKDLIASKGWLAWFSNIARATAGRWQRGAVAITGQPSPNSTSIALTPYHCTLQVKWDNATISGEMVLTGITFDFGIIDVTNGVSTFKASINAAGNIVIPTISGAVTLTAFLQVQNGAL